MRSIILPILLLAAAPAMAAPNITGNWLTDDGKGVVRIGPCGRQMCGWIARVLDRGPSVPTRDVNNPEPGLRARPIVGLQTLSGFNPEAASWTGGQAYDPKSGRSYRTTLSLNGDGSLNVRGCVMFICQSRRWTRAR
ncbi:MAG TPA: DUF2147 domain-containing protein [Allosphingosinicella sp.]|nr:DUF2147 domain-containing protein [Allosphingosinicella sp.]